MNVLSIGFLNIYLSHRLNLRLLRLVSCEKQTCYEMCTLKFIYSASTPPHPTGNITTSLTKHSGAAYIWESYEHRVLHPRKPRPSERNSCVPEHESFPDAASHDKRRLTACHFHVTSHRLLYYWLFFVLSKSNTFANLFGYGKEIRHQGYC